MWGILDTIILVFFLGFMLWLGISNKEKNKSAEDFFLGNRSFGWFAAAMSMFATYNSVWAFTGALGYAYKFGIGVMFFYIGCILGSLGQTFFLADRIRATRGLTIFGFIEQRFSLDFRYFAAGSNSLIYLLDGGMRLYATALIPAVFLGWSTQTTVWILFAICIIYVVLGGMRAIVTTDVLQGGLMFGVFVIAFIVGVGKVGGLGQLGLLDPSYYKLGSDAYPWATGLAVAIPSIFTHFMNFAFHGNRLLAVKNEREAKKASLAYAVMTALFGLTVFATGLMLAKAVPNLENVEQGYITFLHDILPTGLLGLFAVAALAATLSTIDSQAHNITGWLVTDIYMAQKLHAGKPLNDTFVVRVSRGVIAIIICCFLGTSSFTSLIGIFSIVTDWLMPLVSPMSVILAAGLLWKRFNNKTAWITLVSSYVVFLVWKFASLPYSGIVVPFFALVMVIAGSYIIKTPAEEKARIDAFFDYLDKNIKAQA